MAKYCDSKVLERNWFMWLAASDTPQLDDLRAKGLVMTRIFKNRTVQMKNGSNRTFEDPYHINRQHCVATAARFKFNSFGGRLAVSTSTGPWRTIETAPGGELCNEVRNELLNIGYYVDKPSTATWQAMCEDIAKMCTGISKKFTLSEAAREDLASDALSQVLNKIRDRKVRYEPGRAPVFNLLTTTIHRIMYSLLGREASIRQNNENVSRMIQSITCSRRPSTKRLVTVRRFGSVVASNG